MNTVFIAGLYLRLSDKDKKKVEENKAKGLRDESLSITNQRNLLLQFLKQSNYKLGDIYIDDGYSGSNFNRPDYKRMINDVETGKINMIITKDLSRLGRDYVEIGNLLERYFPEKNVRYIALDDDIDTFLDNSNNDITPFKSILNDMYARDISKKAKSSIKSRQKEGLYISGRGMFGYDIDPENKHHLIINEEQAKIVRRIFKMCNEGLNCYKIAEILTKENIKTPAQFHNFRWRKAYNYKFGIWHSSSIKMILTNEMYIGNMVQNKRTTINHKLKKFRYVNPENWIIVENTHEPIIDKELFYETQKRIPKNCGRKDKKENHLLDGLLYCHECGYKIFVQGRRKSDNNCYTMCTRYKSTHYSDCSSHCNNYDKLESLIIKTIKDICTKYINEKNISSKVEKEYNKKQSDDFHVDKVKLQNELKQLERQLDDTYIDKLKGIIDDNMYMRVNNRIKNRMEEINSEINSTENNESKKQALIKERKIIKDVINRFLKDPFNSRELLVRLVDRIEIHDDKSIDIKFSFKELC